MLPLPSRNVGCHLLPLRQLPVPPSAATVGRVRHSAPTKFETVSNAVKTTSSNTKCESYWFLRDRQACRRLSTVIAATFAGCSATTCRNSFIQFPSKHCCRRKTVGVPQQLPCRIHKAFDREYLRLPQWYCRCFIATHPQWNTFTFGQLNY